MSSVPTQKQLATIAGVSQSTVSLALAGSPEVSTSQRALIRKLAARMRYRPSVDAQRLAARKTGVKNKGAVLAWINLETTADFWQSHPISRAYWSGAQSQATRLGYKLDAFWLHDPGMTQTRLASILQNRGIEGILFPHYADSGVKINWSVWRKFAVVSLNHPFSPAMTDHVCADFHHNTDLCMAQLLKTNPRRIGLVLKDVFNAETSATCLARFLFQTSRLPHQFQIPPLIIPDVLSEKSAYLTPWLKRWKPDILLTRDYEMQQVLTTCRKILPVSPRLIQLQLNELTPYIAGIDEKNAEIGIAAVELLGGKLHQGKIGFSDSPRTLLIKGQWRPKTC
ncbi:MAG: LacI family DNA-binding transcriptional regulator [Chthoniobacterales bacterium]